MRAFTSPAGSAVVSKAPSLPPSVSNVSASKAETRELEDEIQSLRLENRRLAKENRKSNGIIERYRERWEMLKVGARGRVRDEAVDDSK